MTDLTPVSSSNIAAVGYDPGTRALTVEFRGGAQHVYQDVPAETYEGLIGAESVGGYFHQNVRSSFGSSKIESDPAADA